MTQTRWFCSRCKREWVVAVHWDGVTCPAPDCGATDIAQITYEAWCAGMDIPREDPLPSAFGPVSVLSVVSPSTSIEVQADARQGRWQAIPEFA